MRKTIAITALVCGMLFLLVPRFVLPACEYKGYPHMHCSDTAQAEFAVGALLLLTGGMTLLIRKPAIMPLIGALCSSVLFCLAYWFPVKYGYCQSPNMPCNYGMVPFVHFLSVTGILIMIGAVAGIVNSHRKKGSQ